MFDETSRYHGLDITSIEIPDSDGIVRQVRYVQRRFIPPTDDTLTVLEHIFSAGDRLDNIAARYLGDSLLFWQICDANNILRPDELEQPGTSVKITLPNL